MWVFLTMRDQPLQVMTVYGVAKFNWHGGLAFILLDRFMAFLGNGDTPPAVSVVVATNANFGAVAQMRLYPDAARYGTWFS